MAQKYGKFSVLHRNFPREVSEEYGKIRKIDDGIKGIEYMWEVGIIPAGLFLERGWPEKRFSRCL